MSLIHLNNIGLSYRLDGRAHTALDGINLRIGPGEMIAILGPSGSGKSSLLYVLGALIQPSSGQYLHRGKNIGQMHSNALSSLRARHFGFVFQQFHLLPRMNVLQNVCLPSRYVEEPSFAAEARARQLLQAVGIETHHEHWPNQLSGGQQQRVAIARALINDPSIIFADEPTGNLDSKSSHQVMELFQKIRDQGKTIVIVTHDLQVASRCERVVKLLDGRIVADETTDKHGPLATPPPVSTQTTQTIQQTKPALSVGSSGTAYWREAFDNLVRNKGRSGLTMLGVIVGIAAVLTSITIGTYARDRILESYETLGVNKLVVRAYPNWGLKASQFSGALFDGLSVKNDIELMCRLFPEIQLLSPSLTEFVNSAEAAGRSFENVRLLGVSSEYLAITNRKVVLGQKLTSFHIEQRSPVCLIGIDIAQKLFRQSNPLRQTLLLRNMNDRQYSCQILGVLGSQTSNKEWNKPNEQVLVPYTYFRLITDRWYANIHDLNVQVSSGSSQEELGKKIKAFLETKYGVSAQVRVDTDELLVAQMRRFLGLFAILLTGVAFVSLVVGGVGIANMMLVSISERLKEIGLRRAIGARQSEIRTQFLAESMLLCTLAGALGLLVGILGYHSLLYLGTQLSDKIKFEWFINPFGLIVAVVSMVLVGLVSGLVPALRAERLEIVEALRSE